MIAVNDKVVCIDDVFESGEDWVTPNGNVVQNQTYVVEKLRLNNDGALGLHIVGFPVIWKFDGDEVGWKAWRFRKLEHVRMENELKRLRGVPLGEPLSRPPV